MSDAHETSPPRSLARRMNGLTLIEPIAGAATVISIGLTIKWLGWPTVLTSLEIGFAFLAFVFLWSRSLRAAPGLTKTLTSLAIVGMVMLSVIPAWMVESREDARRRQSMWNLRNLGRDFEYDLFLHPPLRHLEPPDPFSKPPAYKTE